MYLLGTVPDEKAFYAGLIGSRTDFEERLGGLAFVYGRLELVRRLGAAFARMAPEVLEDLLRYDYE